MKKRIITIISFIIFITTVILVCTNNNIIDNYILKIFTYKTPILTNIMKTISFLGSAYTIIILTILLIIVIKNKKNKLLLLFNVIITTLLNQTLKHTFQRIRPINKIVEETGYSFPSGHSMIALSFYGFLIYMIYKSNIKYKKTLITILSILILLIGISRIYLNVHYPTDVIGGFSLSLAYLLLFIEISKPNFTQN